MFKELVKAYKIVGYGLAIKRQMMFAVGFAIIGIVLDIFTGGTQPTGGFYIVLSGMFIYQLIISSDVSTLIQASPYKKKIQCTYPLLATAPWIYLTFTIVAISHYFKVRGGDEELRHTHSAVIMMIGCFLFICLIFFGIVYKYFILSMIIMCLTVTLPMFVINRFIERDLFANYGLCVAIVYVLLTLGCVISCLLARLTYKRDISPIAFKQAMNKS